MVTDVHASTKDGRFLPFHNAVPVSDGWERLGPAIELCLRGGAESLLLLGDLAHLGDEETLGRVVRMAAGSELPVWVVPGNHETNAGGSALGRIVARAGIQSVRLAAPCGEYLDGGIQLAGLSIEGAQEVVSGRVPRAIDVAGWGPRPVVLLSHYPVISSAEEVVRAGLKYAGDLEDAEGIVSRILARCVPTVVLSGHLHVRHTFAQGPVLQILCAALVEPPFEVTLVDVEVERDRVSVSRWNVPVVSSSAGTRLPVLSSVEETWNHEDGSWMLDRSGGPSVEEVGL